MRHDGHAYSNIVLGRHSRKGWYRLLSAELNLVAWILHAGLRGLVLGHRLCRWGVCGIDQNRTLWHNPLLIQVNTSWVERSSRSPELYRKERFKMKWRVCCMDTSTFDPETCWSAQSVTKFSACRDKLSLTDLKQDTTVIAASIKWSPFLYVRNQLPQLVLYILAI